ncbi:MAG: hypothetical protein M1118_10665 [Chloroflexi bacterium]|nr:hypothetical protein [Chloroflexota bacterium]
MPVAWLVFAGVGTFALTALGAEVGLRLFPGFRSIENKSGEYRRDTPSNPRQSSRLPSVIGPVLTLIVPGLLLLTATRDVSHRGPLMLCAVVAFVEGTLGWLDDFSKSRGEGLSEGIRLAAQGAVSVLVAAGLVATGAVSVQSASGVIQLLADVALFVLAVLSTGFADGVDGLVSSFGVISGCGFVLLGGAQGSTYLVFLGILVLASCSGALLSNTPSNWTRTNGISRRARAYLGDSGALVVGALVALPPLQAGDASLLPLIAAAITLEGGSVFIQTGVLTPLYRRFVRLTRFDASKTFVPHVEFPLPYLATPLHYHLNLLGFDPVHTLSVLLSLQLLGVLCAATIRALGTAPAAAGVWMLGLVGLVLVAGVLAFAKRVTVRIETRGGTRCLVVGRGLGLRVRGWALERQLAVVPLGSGELPLPLHTVAVLHRHDAWALAALACWPERPALAREFAARIRPLSLLLRPEITSIVISAAVRSGELSNLVATWRRALRDVYQEGRLDVVLTDLAGHLEASGDLEAAQQCRSQVLAVTPGTTPASVPRQSELVLG